MGPFEFHTEHRLVVLTGLHATTLDDLHRLLGQVPGSSIFYHTHHMYLAHHFETPVFTNDFSLWVTEALQEDALGEKLAAIDLLAHTSVRSIRDALATAVENRLNQPRPQRSCPPGDEFHFCRSKSFVMPTGLVAHNLDEFLAILPGVTNESLFFHLFESRLRLERTTNDFSLWLSGCGEDKLAEAIDRLDPYAVTLDQLKMRIVEVAKSRRA